MKSHFPTVYERCLSVGIDITREPIPIVPAQHYQCGGVVTDLNGATNIARLYAAGEVACTGVHGANRLASNSLLEAMVYGRRAAEHSLSNFALLPETQIPPTRLPQSEDASLGSTRVEALRTHIQQQMQEYVGIVRTTAELECTRERIADALSQLERANPAHVGTWEARNIAQVGLLIVEFALRRHESRGLHYILDYPETDEAQRQDTVLRPAQLTPA